MSNQIITLSKFEEIRFGMRSARAIISTLDELNSILHFCQEHTVKFLITRVDTHEISVVQALEKNGFQLMDTLIYYKRDLSIPYPSISSDYEVVYASLDDLEEIQSVTRKTFKGYMNHYLADARLDPQKCDEVYVDWAARSCKKETADEMILVKQENRIMGYLTLRNKTSQEVEGPLFAVSPESQGQGVGRILMLAGLDWARKQGGDYFVIPTQITNRASQTLWVKLGFEMENSYYTFHKWFDER